MIKALLPLFLFITLHVQAQQEKTDPEFVKKYMAEIKKFNAEKDSVNNTADFYYKRGGIRQDYLDLENAVADYSLSIAKDPTNYKTWYNRGLAKLDLKLLPEAITDFNKTVELNPLDTFAYNNRGICKYDLKEYAAAIDDYNKAISINNNFAEAYNNRGISLIRLGKTDEGCEDLHTAYNKGHKQSLKGIKKYCNKK